jgi:hypothetical protein
MRQRDVDVGQPLGECLGDRPLVAGVCVGVQQDDRDRLRLERGDGLRQRGRVVERAQHAVRAGALGCGHAQGRRHERRRSRRAQAVEVGTRLAAELDEIGEALGRDEHGARAATLEQRVRCDGHAVGEDLDVAGRRAGALEHGLDRRHDTLGLVVGRRRRLRGQQPSTGGEHRVGEGPADVDAEQHQWFLW